MKGEFISIETARIMADVEKENKELQQRIDKAIKYIKNKGTRINKQDIKWSDEWLLHFEDNYKAELLNILEGKDESKRSNTMAR